MFYYKKYSMLIKLHYGIYYLREKGNFQKIYFYDNSKDVVAIKGLQILR